MRIKREDIYLVIIFKMKETIKVVCGHKKRQNQGKLEIVSVRLHLESHNVPVGTLLSWRNHCQGAEKLY